MEDFVEKGYDQLLNAFIDFIALIFLSVIFASCVFNHLYVISGILFIGILYFIYWVSTDIEKYLIKKICI